MAYLKVVSLRLSPREMKSSSIPRLLVRESRVKRLDALQDKLISMLLWKRGTLRFTQTAHFPFSYFWWLRMVLLISVASWRFPENQLLCIQALSFQVLDEILAMAIVLGPLFALGTCLFVSQAEFQSSRCTHHTSSKVFSQCSCILLRK